MRIKEMIANLRSCDCHTNSPSQCQGKCIKKIMENKVILEENFILVQDDTLYLYMSCFSIIFQHLLEIVLILGRKIIIFNPSVSLRVTRYSSLVLSVIQSNIQTGIIMHQTSVLWKSSHFVLCAILMQVWRATSIKCTQHITHK